MRYKCNMCGKKFDHKNDWRRHKARKRPCQKVTPKRLLKNAPKFPCPNCDKKYTRKFNLYRHLRTVHGISDLYSEMEQKLEQNPRSLLSSPESDEEHDEYDTEFSDDIHGSSQTRGHTSEMGAMSSQKRRLFCSFCKKSITRKNFSRHKRVCKMRLEHLREESLNAVLEAKDKMLSQKEEEILKLKNEKDKQLIALKQEKEEIEKQYLEFMKEMARKSTNKIVYNNNRNVNMFYIINNYDDAENYEALMCPKLSTGEISYLHNKGPITGGYQLIMDRCVTGKDMDKRPFHCVDESRNKYLLRTNNDWKVDNGGQRIIEDAIEKIRGAYNTEIKYNDTREVRDKKLAIISDLMDLEIKGKKRILKELNKHTLLKNNVEE